MVLFSVGYGKRTRPPEMVRTSGSSSDARPNVVSTAPTTQTAGPARPPPPHLRPQTQPARQRSVPLHSPAARAQVSPPSTSQQSAPGGAGDRQAARGLPSSRHSFNAPQPQAPPPQAPQRLRAASGARLSEQRAQPPLRPTQPVAAASASLMAGAPVAPSNMTFIAEPQGPSMGHARVPALNLPEVRVRVQI